MKHCAKCRGEFPDDLVWCPVCSKWEFPTDTKQWENGTGMAGVMTDDERYPSLTDVEMQIDLAHGKDWHDI